MRAAPGCNPVIDVELKGTKPLLALGSGTSLELSGITINAYYPADSQTAVPTTAAPPPLISSAATTTLKRCAFRVASASKPRGSRAVFADMGALTVDRCWFEGFDEAIEISAGRGTRTEIKQTMFVPPSERDPAQDAHHEWYGWGIKVKFVADARPEPKNPQPNILLDHCTLEGGGVIDMAASPGPDRVRIKMNHCLLRANALLALDRKRLPNDQVSWQGDANQYDIQGKSWFVLSASEGTPAFSASITDLELASQHCERKQPDQDQAQIQDRSLRSLQLARAA